MELISNLSCRICFINASARAANAEDVAGLFHEITGYEIHANDMPKKICSQCLENLYFIKAFRQTCEKSESFLDEFREKSPKNEVVFLQELKVEIPVKEEITAESPKVSPVPVVEENNPPPTTKKRKYYDRYKVVCTLCGEHVIHRYMKTHIEKIHENRRFECDFCGKIFREKPGLRKHMQQKHMNRDNRYPCDVCGKVFNGWTTRYIHVRVNHSANPRPFECDICKKRYKTAFTLKHHKSTHSAVPTFACSHCDGMFFNELRLKCHLKLQHSDRTCTCPTCGKKFKNDKQLRQHKLAHQPNKYFCPVCPSNYSQNNSLRAHVAKLHPEYKLPPRGTILRNVDINELNAK